jgi:4-hydroxy-3-methylbut-2-en-1-yl diphosphate reductase
MKILRAAHLGFCFGVKDAIDLALDHPGPMTVLGELVHNEAVLYDLRSHGIRFAAREDDISTRKVMITAHGASDRAIASLRTRGLEVIEATCPLVKRAHLALRHLVRAGFHPVVIGRRGHVEVRGLTEDFDGADIVLTDEDVAQLKERDRYGIVAQTTQPPERVRRLLDLIRARFPGAEVRFVDTVCQPTKLRQKAALEMALRADVVVVVGGPQSNNTRELVATCARYCSRVHHIQCAADLQPEWFEGAETVGLTAGTSTPGDTIEAVERQLKSLVPRREAPVAMPITQAVPEHELAGATTLVPSTHPL